MQTRRDGSTMTLAQSKRASDLQTDINAWEENRLFRSGVVRLKEVHPAQPLSFWRAHLAGHFLPWLLHSRYYSCT